MGVAYSSERTLCQALFEPSRGSVPGPARPRSLREAIDILKVPTAFLTDKQLSAIHYLNTSRTPLPPASARAAQTTLAGTLLNCFVTSTASSGKRIDAPPADSRGLEKSSQALCGEFDDPETARAWAVCVAAQEDCVPPSSREIESMVVLLRSPRDRVNAWAVCTLAERCSDDTNLLHAIYVFGGLGPLVKLLETRSRDIQFYAAMLLARITEHVHDARSAMFRLANAKSLIRCMIGADPQLQEWLCQCIGYCVYDNPSSADGIHAAGGVKAMVRLLRSPCESTQGAAAFALGRIVASSQKARDAIRHSAGLVGLLSLLWSDNTNVLKWAVSAIAHCIQDSPENADGVRLNGGHVQLVTLLSWDDEEVQWRVARVLGRMAELSALNRVAIFKCGGILALEALASNTPSRYVQAEATEALSAATVDDPELDEITTSDSSLGSPLFL